MKILVEISHPAHVHYFKNLIKLLNQSNNSVVVVAKNKEVTFELLNAYKIKFYKMLSSKKYFLSKVIGLIIDDILLFLYSLKFKPDLYLSFSSPYVGHIAFIMRKYHIVFDDTEHASLEHLMYKPFASEIITPTFFSKNLGRKHIKFNSVFELCYLHPKYFKCDYSVLDDLNLRKNERFIILRFISWDAIHDKGQKGMSYNDKIEAVEKLSAYAKVFISSEKKLPDNLLKYKLNISPEKMHSLISCASLFFGESGTMAVEAALLGTPSVRVSTLASSLGNFKELKNKYKLIHYYSCGKKGLEKSIELIKDNKSKNKWIKRKDVFINDKLDSNKYMFNRIINKLN